MATPTNTDQVPDYQFNEIRRRINDDSTSVLDTPVGEMVYDRLAFAQGTAQATQALQLAGFTARATQNISQIRVWTGTTAAAATPTLCRMGVYVRDSSNLYTLVASTANDTTLFAAASTTYTRSFTTPFLKTAGTDYLVAVLVVSGVAIPNFAAPFTGWSTAIMTDSA